MGVYFRVIVFISGLVALALIYRSDITSGLTPVAFASGSRTGHAIAADPLAPVRLGINKYLIVELSDARADQIIADAVKILNDNDGTGDVSCVVDLIRDGPVSTFDIGNGIVNSQADYDAVCATPGWVHLVEQINYCGGPIPDIAGCSDTPGTCMVLVRLSDDQE